MSEAEDFWAEVARLTQPQPEAKIFYRLYHDVDGHPLFYSMEDLPGNYIEIDQPTFARSSSRVRVVDGKLIQIETNPAVGKLQPSNTGTPCDPRDICVVVSEEQSNTKWKKKHES